METEKSDFCAQGVTVVSVYRYCMLFIMYSVKFAAFMNIGYCTNYVKTVSIEQKWFAIGKKKCRKLFSQE